MTKRLLFMIVTCAAFAPAVFAQCSASAAGSTVAAAEINAKMCATETFTVGTGGVTANTLVIMDTSNPAKAIAATGSGGYGVALTTASANSTVAVKRYGQVQCVMDNAAVAGDLVIAGSGTANDCRDAGQTASSAISLSTRIIGVLLTSASQGSTALVELTPAHFGTQVPAAITLIVGGQNATVTTASISATVRAVRACNLVGWSLQLLSGDSGTATVKFWKVASGTAVPTSANSINTSGVSLASGTAVASTVLTDFTGTALSVGDMIVMAATAVSGSISTITGTLTCE